MTQLVVLGNPENRRVRFFQEALARWDQSPATVIAYEELLAGRQTLANVVRPGACVRIDSPGENFAVEKLLLRAGYEEAEAERAPVLTPAALEQLEFDPGRILHPRQWYLGFCRMLRHWQAELEAIGEIQLLSAPAEIELMFDKPRCHARCASAGLPVPASLGPIHSYDELRARMTAAGWQRVFVKLAHGSSASGVVALHLRGAKVEAITSAELVRAGGEVRLYNSLRLRRYTAEEDIRDLIDALSRERVHVERWLPKASLGHRQVFDLRLVVIDRQPTHCVVRQGAGPMTNLHLGNRRGDWETVQARLGPERLAALHQTARAAAALFPGSLQVALDVLLSPNLREHAILEINAFGDLLPGVLHEGLDTYATQVAAIVRRQTE